MKRVCVIGAGSSGLTAIKCCKEESIDVVCFEKTGDIGGLWRYHDEVEDSVASVMKSTVINTCKEMSAFSDFPPPKEFPNYMHNRMMHKYFQMYAEKFGLMDHVLFHQEVLRVQPAMDYDATGRWVVTHRDTREQNVADEVFDGVMVCIGHHVKPHTPNFPGLEDFKGKILHTHSLKVPDAFKDLRVLVIGAGNSGLDAAVEISNVAEQVYLSTRRGTWVTFRLGKDGLPSDAQLFTRMNYLKLKLLGWKLSNRIIEPYIDANFNHSLYGIRPKHGFFNQHPSINDHLPNKILSGTIILKNNVSGFLESGVTFDGEGDTVTEIDVAIFATGYEIVLPFLSEDILRTANNQVNLYKYAFPPLLKHPSLIIIGLVQIVGPLFPVTENQSRWFALLMNGKVKLPPVKTMLRSIEKRRKYMEKRYVESPRHTIQADFIPCMDEVASEYGAKPNMLKLLFTDPKLFKACVFGPCLPYQYRLTGPHPWPEARETILKYKERVLFPLLKGRHAEKSHHVCSKTAMVLALLFAGLTYTVYCFNTMCDRRY